jgi:uncharacterized protein YecE (DUF72 family)
MSAGRNQRVFIGTSGWVYKEWANDFYRGCRPKDYFAFYASRFPTVEINATFYRLPDLAMVHRWRCNAPKNFLFAVKGSRFITHMKRLKNLQFSAHRFFRRIRPLLPRMGPILWQLPPNLKEDRVLLRNFLRRLPVDFSHAFEFRDNSWMNDGVLALLREHNAALVWVSSLKMPADFSVTANFIYARFHGLEGGPYHDYTDEELAPFAAQIRTQAAQGRPVYAYFNNDLNVRAPDNAHRLMTLCDVAVPAGWQENPVDHRRDGTATVGPGPSVWRKW